MFVGYHLATTSDERLFEAAQALPEPLLEEVLDFAGFLRAKTIRMLGQVADGFKSSLASLAPFPSPRIAIGAWPLYLTRSGSRLNRAWPLFSTKLRVAMLNAHSLHRG